MYTNPGRTDLQMPNLGPREHDSMTGIVWLIAITISVTLVTWIALMVIHGDHDPNAAASPSERACFNQELQKSVDSIVDGGPTGDTSRCFDRPPAYAAHPFWYALVVGLAVFVIGRIALFMVRMERR